MANTRPPRSAAAKAREYLAVTQWVGRSRRHASKHPIRHDPGDVPTCNIRKRMNLTALPVSSTIANTRPPLIAAVKAWEYLAVAQRVGRWGRHTSYPRIGQDFENVPACNTGKRKNLATEPVSSAMANPSVSSQCPGVSGFRPAARPDAASTSKQRSFRCEDRRHTLDCCEKLSQRHGVRFRRCLE